DPGLCTAVHAVLWHCRLFRAIAARRQLPTGGGGCPARSGGNAFPAGRTHRPPGTCAPAHSPLIHSGKLAAHLPRLSRQRFFTHGRRTVAGLSAPCGTGKPDSTFSNIRLASAATTR